MKKDEIKYGDTVLVKGRVTGQSKGGHLFHLKIGRYKIAIHHSQLLPIEDGGEQ